MRHARKHVNLAVADWNKPWQSLTGTNPQRNAAALGARIDTLHRAYEDAKRSARAKAGYVRCKDMSWTSHNDAKRKLCRDLLQYAEKGDDFVIGAS